MVQTKKLNKLGLICSTGLLIIFGLIHLHAPMSVWLGTSFSEYSLLIKAWKEIILLLLTPLVGILAWRSKLLPSLARDKLLVLILAYALVHLALIAVFRQDYLVTIAGLAIDLRYLLFFVLAYVVVKAYPSFRRYALAVSAVGAAIVMLFGLLQIFILPNDILSGIGYSKDTIAPYLTIDKNEDFVRINSTMRGPNPLGAYTVIVIGVAGAYALSRELKGKYRQKGVYIAGALAAASPAVLWASYSRSAWLGFAVASALTALLVLGRKLPGKLWLAMFLVPLLLGGTALYALKDTAFVANVVEHRDPADPVQDNSNDGHLRSLFVGSEKALRQPLGAGPGSTGSASLLSSKPTIIENQYLFVAHESGWVGLILFGAISVMVLVMLWLNRRDWLSAGLFASGIGLLIIGLLLPVWADDTVSLVWWGLSAVAIGGRSKIKNRGHML